MLINSKPVGHPFGSGDLALAVVAAPQATTHKLASRPAIFLMTAPPLLTFGEACKAPVAVRFQFSCRWGNRLADGAEPGAAGGVPGAVDRLAGGRVWRRAEVERWAKEKLPLPSGWPGKTD
jgi:hypothetical protein